MYEEFAERIANLRRQYSAPLLIHKREHIFYLTGFIGTAGVLLVDNRSAWLFVDGRYYESARTNKAHVKTVYVEKNYPKTIAHFLKKNKYEKILILPAGLLLEEYETLTRQLAEKKIEYKKTLEDAVSTMREVKNKNEINIMKENLFLAERAFTKTLAFIKDGMSEKELALELDYRMRREGADGLSFDTIVLFGERTAHPHGQPSNATLSNGELVLIDFGLVKDGYCTDTTRTFLFGKPKNYTRIKRIYDAVQEAQSAGIENARSGLPYFQADEAARNVLKSHKLGKYFTHGIGHGVGIEIHEAPYPRNEDKTLLKRGSIITIEPGVYIPEIGGIRIENEVITTIQGGVTLNSIPTDLIIL